MKTRFTLAFGALALALPGTALAKGPPFAKITGPGLSAPITFRGSGEQPGTKLGDFVDLAGFFPAVFKRQPDPMLRRAPTNALGPRYTVVYRVPMGAVQDAIVRQSVYPYAHGGPVTYTRPGQRMAGAHTVRGGWFRALRSLKTMLVAAGLPARAPR